MLVVEVDRPGAEPRVTAHRVARFTWQRLAATLERAEDVAALERQLEALPDRSNTLVELVLEGHLDLTLRARVEHEILARYRGIFPMLRVRDEGLFVRLTDADLEQLPRDGWIGKLVERLRKGVPGYTADECQESLRKLHDLYQSVLRFGGAS